MQISPFLMFDGEAEAAVRFYVEIFEGAELLQMTFQENGKVEQAAFSIQGMTFMAIDSPTEHDFAFTPAISLYLNFDSPQEIDYVYEKLKRGGAILMPLDSYPHSRKFAWVQDKFGVTWQLNLPDDPASLQ